MRAWLVTAWLSAACAAACASPRDSSASVTFAISRGDFTSGSVRICGSRPEPTSSQICDFSLAPASGDDCRCFEFGADGSLVDPVSGDPARVGGLCPSSVAPSADWSFSYAIFEDAACQGVQLNDGAHNLVCYDSSDLRTQAHPNQSVEPLWVGLNDNHIVCLAETAAKSWNVSRCYKTDLPDDLQSYDCGCIEHEDTCDCGEGGITEAELPIGCRFDLQCDILCDPGLSACLCRVDANCNDDNECTFDRCAFGICRNLPLIEGTLCEGGTCNSAGLCEPSCMVCVDECGPGSPPPASFEGIVGPVPADSVPPQAPFSAVQYGTNGCIEVGVRPDAPFNQPRPLFAPEDYDITSGYPPFGYDPTGFTETNGVNSCRYNFRDINNVVIGSAYCVQWAAGQRSGTGYDTKPAANEIRNAGYVWRILQNYWPATNAPMVPSTNATVINRQRSGVVAMAIHYFTDHVVMPPNYQDPALYAAVAEVVNGVLAAGPAEAPLDPTPSIVGPSGGDVSELLGPYTIGSNAAGDLTVTISGAEAFTDAAATLPFISGSTLAPGAQLWLRSTTASLATIFAQGLVPAAIGTWMVGDPTYRVQQMMLAEPLTLIGKAEYEVTIVPDDPARVTSQVSASLIEAEQSVSDTITISGLAGGTATVTATLYGPLPPVLEMSCEGIDWTGSPPIAIAFVPVLVVGDTTLVTPSNILTEAGCYSFGVSLVPEVGVAVSIPPGTESETLRVIPRVIPPILEITTQTCPHVLSTGSTVIDTITVRGLFFGRSVTMRPMLLGPVSPRGSTCAGIDWTVDDLPIFTTFPSVTMTAEGTITTPPQVLSDPGCYNFVVVQTNDAIRGGIEPTVHGQGDPNEIIHIRTYDPEPCVQ